MPPSSTVPRHPARAHPASGARPPKKMSTPCLRKSRLPPWLLEVLASSISSSSTRVHWEVCAHGATMNRWMLCHSPSLTLLLLLRLTVDTPSSSSSLSSSEVLWSSMKRKPSWTESVTNAEPLSAWRRAAWRFRVRRFRDRLVRLRDMLPFPR